MTGWAVGDLAWVNRALIELEQLYLTVLHDRTGLASLTQSPLLPELFAWIDANPYQAVGMARIKSGHAFTPRHGMNVMLLTRAWAGISHKLGPKLDLLSIAALIHDLGHWRPSNLVFVFGNFTHEQARQMQKHPDFSWEGEATVTDEMARWIQQHHEQPDGKGYPRGITSPDPQAQLIRIADVFDGLTTPRRTRLTYSAFEAMNLMRRWAGYKFSTGLFKSFERFIGAWPVGTFLQMEDGAIAVALPPEGDKTPCLMLTNSQGDTLPNPSPCAVSEKEVTGQAQQWREPEIPSDWGGLRPDLLGLPRSY